MDTNDYVRHLTGLSAEVEHVHAEAQALLAHLTAQGADTHLTHLTHLMADGISALMDDLHRDIARAEQEASDTRDRDALVAESAQIQREIDVLRHQLLQLRGDMQTLQQQAHAIVVRFRAQYARQQAIAQALADDGRSADGPPTRHTP